jgi:hypothetical protein
VTAAILGLLGVLVGGLITYWTQRGSERRRERREAKVAARLVLEELKNTEIALEVVKEEPSWEIWAAMAELGDLQVSRWKEQQATLAGVASLAQYQAVADAVSQLARTKSFAQDEGDISASSQSDMRVSLILVGKARSALEPLAYGRSRAAEMLMALKVRARRAARAGRKLRGR